MIELGEYVVTGRRNYRGHTPGSIFEAQHDPAKQRAINRGDIRLLRVFTPTVPAEHEFPDGWLNDEAPTKGAYVGTVSTPAVTTGRPKPILPSVSPQANPEAPQGASLVSEGG